MESLSFYFALQFFCYCVLMAPLSQALDALLSSLMPIFFGVVVFLTALGLFLFLMLVWKVTGAIKRKKERINALEAAQRPRPAKQIHALVNQIVSE